MCKMCCNLIEFCICGVKMNIFFLLNVVCYLDFVSGNYNISFIDIILELFKFLYICDCGIKMLCYIGNVMVNGFLGIKYCDKFVYVELCLLKILYGL